MTPRRLTGAVMRIGYEGGFLDSAYSITLNISCNEIDVTAVGDFPYDISEPGFIKISIDLSMREGPDAQFIENHALNRTPFNITIYSNRANLNGRTFGVYAAQAKHSGDVKSAQDRSFTLTLAQRPN